MKRRELISVASVSLLSGRIWAQSAKPIRLIVPFPAGGPTDLVARVLAEPLSAVLNQPIAVDNKGGAGGSAGMTELARAQPDGATFGIASVSTHGVNPAVYKSLPYDPVKDFSPVTEFVKAPVALVVHPSLPVRTITDLVAYLKKNPGRISYGSPGVGTTPQMLAELFKSSTGTFMTHIPYLGTGPAMADLLGGQIQVYFDQVASSIAHIKSGKLRALAVSWAQRLDVLPDVPTFAEASLFTNNSPTWFGVLAPAKTPEAEVRRMHQAILKVIAQPAARQRFAQLGLFASGSSPSEFSTLIEKEIATMTRVARFARISLG